MEVEKKPPVKSPGKVNGGRGDGQDPQRNMGDALRSVYDETVQEAVPDDLLALLSKLD